MPLEPKQTVAPSVAAATASSSHPPEETRWDVILKSAGPNRINVIRVLKEDVGLDIRTAKDLSEAAPVVLLEACPEARAEKIAAALKEAGASVGLGVPFSRDSKELKELDAFRKELRNKNKEGQTDYSCACFVIVALAVIGAAFMFYSLMSDDAGTTPEQRKINAQRAAESAAKDIASEKRAGPRPSDWEAKSLLKGILRDPDSLVVEDRFIIFTEGRFAGEPCWKTRLNIRANNGFGGVDRRRVVLYVKDGRLIGTEGFE